MRLIPMTLQHLEWVRRQRNSPELMKYFRQTHELSEENQKSWWNNLIKENVRLFIIYRDEYAVGYAGLNPIDWRHKHAEFGIFITPQAQGVGVGKWAMIELLRYGFEELKLHKIYSDVLDYPDENKFDFYKKLGFKQDGVNFQQYLKDGTWIDSISFSMLENEYKSIYGKNNKSGLGLRETSGIAQNK